MTYTVTVDLGETGVKSFFCALGHIGYLNKEQEQEPAGSFLDSHVHLRLRKSQSALETMAKHRDRTLAYWWHKIISDERWWRPQSLGSQIFWFFLFGKKREKKECWFLCLTFFCCVFLYFFAVNRQGESLYVFLKNKSLEIKSRRSSIPPPLSALAYPKPSGPRALLIVRHHSGTSSTAEYPRRVWFGTRL